MEEVLPGLILAAQQAARTGIRAGGVWHPQDIPRRIFPIWAVKFLAHRG
jgi:hypothetical protein